MVVRLGRVTPGGSPVRAADSKHEMDRSNPPASAKSVPKNVAQASQTGITIDLQFVSLKTEAQRPMKQRPAVEAAGGYILAAAIIRVAPQQAPNLR